MTTDGAAAVTGQPSGVVKWILARAPSEMFNHCFLHREALAAKDMVPELHTILHNVIKCVNYIKKSSRLSRCFQAFCRDLESEHQQVLYHAGVRWLSRDKLLSRFYELRTFPL